MKKTAFLFLLVSAATSALAQTDVAPATAPSAAVAEDAAAQHERINAQRQAIEQRYDAERAQCYQKSAVQDCLNESRRRRRVQTDELNRQETALNDIERKRRGDAALQRLEDKGAPVAGTGPKDGARGMQGQADREQQAADRAAQRAAEAAEAAANRKAYADKQRRHAEEAAQREQEAAQAAAERARYEQRLQKAQEEQAARAKRNAERTKPRGAPLPVPE